jgi:hypothetical protein
VLRAIVRVSKPQKLERLFEYGDTSVLYLYLACCTRGTRSAYLYEALQAYTEDDALYTANLMHMDSNAVIKVVRFGLNLACFPDEHAVELCERQIAQQQKRLLEQEEV